MCTTQSRPWPDLRGPRARRRRQDGRPAAPPGERGRLARTKGQNVETLKRRDVEMGSIGVSPVQPIETKRQNQTPKRQNARTPTWGVWASRPHERPQPKAPRSSRGARWPSGRGVRVVLVGRRVFGMTAYSVRGSLARIVHCRSHRHPCRLDVRTPRFWRFSASIRRFGVLTFCHLHRHPCGLDVRTPRFWRSTF